MEPTQPTDLADQPARHIRGGPAPQPPSSPGNFIAASGNGHTARIECAGHLLPSRLALDAIYLVAALAAAAHWILPDLVKLLLSPTP